MIFKEFSALESTAQTAFNKLTDKIQSHFTGSEIIISISHQIVYEREQEGFLATAIICYKED